MKTIEDHLKKDIKYNSIKEWDSVGHMTMIGKLEEAFNITMEMDDIIPPQHQEVLRKVAGRPRSPYELGFITEEVLSNYDLTLKDL